MPDPTQSSRRPGAPAGNRKRLTNGLYTRLAGEHRAATRRIVVAVHEIRADVGAADRYLQALNRTAPAKRQTAKIEVRIALMLFKYMSERLKAAGIPADYPFEPVSPRPGRKRDGGVQSHSGEGALAAVSPVESL